MKVVVPIWKGRVSPVFDTAGTLLVVDFENNREVSRRQIELRNESFTYRVKSLKDIEAEALLCGAISRPLFEMVVAAGVEVTPFLSGEVEALLEKHGDASYLLFPEDRSNPIRFDQHPDH